MSIRRKEQAPLLGTIGGPVFMARKQDTQALYKKGTLGEFTYAGRYVPTSSVTYPGSREQVLHGRSMRGRNPWGTRAMAWIGVQPRTAYHSVLPPVTQQAISSSGLRAFVRRRIALDK